MSAKWKKAIWAILMLQLLLLHGYVIYRGYVLFDALVYRISTHVLLSQEIGKAAYFLVVLFSIMVAFCLGIYHGIQYSKFFRNCVAKLYQIEQADILYSYENACEKAGISAGRKPELYFCREITSPFVTGFVKPMILLPEQCHKEQLPLILLHECTHVKHRDTVYKLFMLILNDLLWFQPLAWLFRYLSYRDIEIACDEAVVADKTEEERFAYGQFLIDSLRLAGKQEMSYSNFLSSSKSMMKARISAVTEGTKKWDWYARIGVVFLAAETILLGGWLFTQVYLDYEEKTMPVNIYENAALPECYTNEAVEAMMALTPYSEDEYSNQIFENAQFPRMEYMDLPYAAKGPWQIRVNDMCHYLDAVNPLFDRYVYYYENQAVGSEKNYEGNDSCLTEMPYRRLLAGDYREFVVAVCFREYMPEYKENPLYQQGKVMLSEENGVIWGYYTVAIHAKLVQDYVYELQGIADFNETLAAYREKYPKVTFEDIPQFHFAGLAEEKTYSVARDGDEYQLVILGRETPVTVPVTKEKLLNRGDDRDGILTRLQDGSYQCDERKQIFVYGGYYDGGTGETVPLSCVYYNAKTDSWKEAVIATNQNSTRLIFTSFPENEMTGYVMVTCDRTMSTEGRRFFKTTDGGETWEELPDTEYWFLTTDMNFISDEVGFYTLDSSEKPDFYRTEDGGKTWQPVSLPEVPEYYTMAYAPFMEDGILKLYVGMTDYAKMSGTQAYYISEDKGKTWEYQGMVMPEGAL